MQQQKRGFSEKADRGPGQGPPFSKAHRKDNNVYGLIATKLDQ